MALTQKLEIRQSHALVMTPQLMQAIKLLQLSNLDLAAYVEDELERNPLLERAPEETMSGESGESERMAAVSEPEWPDDGVPAIANGGAEETDLGNVFSDESGPALGEQ